MKNSHENDLVKRYMPIAKYVAIKYSRKTPSWILFDDLFSVGMFGILISIRSGKTANSDIKQRIVWSIIDELRSGDSLSNKKRTMAYEMEYAKFELTKRLCRNPSQKEVADWMGIDVTEYHRRMFLCRNSKTSVEDECISADDNVFNRILVNEAIDHAGLSRRELQVLHMYYVMGYNLIEIGEKIGVGEARVCQIRKTILEKIASVLTTQ